MAGPDRLALLQQQFETGESPLAFIPYAQALRREHYLHQAIEVCQKGVGRAPSSVAGRALLGRLLCDDGKYNESLAILEEASQLAQSSKGVSLAMARTLLRMHEFERAGRYLEIAANDNPFDPEVQLLSTALRRMKGQERVRRVITASASADPLPTTIEEVLDCIWKRVSAVTPLCGGVLASLRGRYEVVRRGGCEPLIAALESFRECRKAYEELELGELLRGQLDFGEGWILFTGRDDDLALLAGRAQDRIGRVRAAFEMAASNYLPIQAADTNILEAEE